MTRVRSRNASTSSYCSWGKHRVYSVTQFEQGTMCIDCQMAIGEHIVKTADFPELSVALTTATRVKMAKSREKVATTERVRGESELEGFVYYIRINGQIKIGYAADVTARMRNYPPGSELLAVEPGTLETERIRHREFCNNLVRGREWFLPSTRLMRHIQNVVEERGDPAALAYKFRAKAG